jgi:hypothetical protein
MGTKNNFLNYQPTDIYYKGSMDYLKHYNSLIKKARERSWQKEVYSENHHIVPRSEGGSNDPSNLVKLTAREHFLAHWLLYRIDPENSSRAHSFWRMCRGRGKVLPENWITIPSRVYEEARLAHSKAISKRLKGRKKTLEHVAKVVAATTGRKRSAEARMKMSEAAKKRGAPSGFSKMLEVREQQNKKQQIPVLMLDLSTQTTVKTFTSLKEAALFVNRDIANISIAIKKFSMCAGYLWKKLDIY